MIQPGKAVKDPLFVVWWIVLNRFDSIPRKYDTFNKFLDGGSHLRRMPKPSIQGAAK